MPGFMAGHGGGAWIFGRDSVSATNFRVTRMDFSTVSTPLEGETVTFTAQGGAFAAGNSNYIHGANIVAPEPAAFLPLSLGLLLLRRRRR